MCRRHYITWSAETILRPFPRFGWHDRLGTHLPQAVKDFTLKMNESYVIFVCDAHVDTCWFGEHSNRSHDHGCTLWDIDSICTLREMIAAGTGCGQAMCWGHQHRYPGSSLVASWIGPDPKSRRVEFMSIWISRTGCKKNLHNNDVGVCCYMIIWLQLQKHVSSFC